MAKSSVALALAVGLLVVFAAAVDATGGSGGKVYRGETKLNARLNTKSKGKGSAKLWLRDSGSHTAYLLLYGSITNVTMAHVHQGSVAVAGPVRLGVVPYIQGPNPVLLNPYYSYLGTVTYWVQFTNADLASWIPGSKPTAAYAQFKSWLMSGQLYFNVHTVAFPGGEIAGNFKYIK